MFGFRGIRTYEHMENKHLFVLLNSLGSHYFVSINQLFLLLFNINVMLNKPLKWLIQVKSWKWSEPMTTYIRQLLSNFCFNYTLALDSSSRDFDTLLSIIRNVTYHFITWIIKCKRAWILKLWLSKLWSTTLQYRIIFLRIDLLWHHRKCQQWFLFVLG